MREIFRTKKDAADYLGTSLSSLDKWYAEKVGPRYIVLPNSKIAYAKSDLDEWIETRRSDGMTAQTRVLQK